ncbi:MAG: hypothetical protein LKJ25_00140 [Clostridia bacterium]|nr:hypothetical protein [Clostridia bacterium]
MGIFSWFMNKHSKPKHLSYEELYGYTLNFRAIEAKDECFDNGNLLYKNYTLYSMDEEYLKDFNDLTNSIVKEIFKGYKVLIEIELWDKKSYEGVDYIECICKKFNGNNAEIDAERMFLDGEKSFVLYCDSKNTSEPIKYIEREGVLCTTNIYGLNKETDITSLDQAKAVIKDNMYDMAIHCERYPDEIKFIIGSNIDLNYVIEGIKNVCREKKKTLYIEYPYAEE